MLIWEAERVEKDTTEGERYARTSDTIYDLSSVLFHALQGALSDTCIEDAGREGDEELTEFFRRVWGDRDPVAEARMMLVARTPTAARARAATADIGAVR